MTKENLNELFFKSKLLPKLDDWKKKRKAEGKGYSDEAFADTVGVSRGSVARWKMGKIPDEVNMKALCKELGVPDDYFQITSVEDMFQYSQEYITSEVGKKRVEKAKEVGLNLDLVKVLSEIMDFDKLFPAYAPINDFRMKGIFEREFSRSEHMNSAPIDESLKFLQVNQDGRIKTLNDIDIIYLKEVQDQIVDFVEYLFYKRSREMEREVEKFNSDSKIVKNENGKKQTLIKSISKDYILEHDRFAKYLTFEKDEERKDDENNNKTE